MKKRIISALLLGTILFGMTTANANESEPELKLMNCTAYVGGTVTSTGTTPRKGICAADADHVGDGWVAVVYRACPDGNGGYTVGEKLYILECQDTGGYAVSHGYNIDVWAEDIKDAQYIMETVYDFNAKGKVFVQFVQGKG